ncbi:MAG: hypothetical protein JRF59_13330 [Deltaproteobacteria bacterium]|nr:hypothetical protein [Deltaproteobacteria bacterium]MBW2008706.1 hypothetical protein [Deltaproteobacteria bacterium]MBW2348802.1 hypothetical protein [Deltaproteobacteria bacterium]
MAKRLHVHAWKLIFALLLLLMGPCPSGPSAHAGGTSWWQQGVNLLNELSHGQGKGGLTMASERRHKAEEART